MNKNTFKTNLIGKIQLIICDDLNIGGVQRLALDQAYQLSDYGKNLQIFVLSGSSSNGIATFTDVEKELINLKSIVIHYFPGNKWQQLFKLIKYSNQFDIEIIISHSLRGSVIFSLIRLITFGKYKIVTTMHQLLSMSARKQLIKRFLYSQFTDVLFGFSMSLIIDWHIRRRKNLFIRVITCRKKISLCRNGVYLERLDSLRTENEPRVYRFVFIGRLTAWKGLDTFVELGRRPEFAEVKFLLVTPSDPTPFLKNVEKNILQRMTFESGKTLSDIKFTSNDLHIYPANYGENSIFAEGVSINVLEMACLGISSVITMNGNLTWPELTELGITREAYWDKPQVVVELISKMVEEEIPDFATARKIIDIKNNLCQIYSTANIKL
jgi:glycosyltransferase involved in cell wall biosynthesis